MGYRRPGAFAGIAHRRDGRGKDLHLLSAVLIVLVDFLDQRVKRAGQGDQAQCAETGADVDLPEVVGAGHQQDDGRIVGVPGSVAGDPVNRGALNALMGR